MEAARAKKNAAPVKPELQSSYKYDDLIALLKGPVRERAESAARQTQL